MSQSLSLVEIRLDPAEWSDHLGALTRAGINDSPPWVPPVWFYDDVGSELFDRITRLDEYYPTRTERELLIGAAEEIAATTGTTTLIELGSGSSEKTRVLLDGMCENLHDFCAFDVSQGILEDSIMRLTEEYPELGCFGIVGDFHHHLDPMPPGRVRTVAFLGGTIGNFEVLERRRFLRSLRASVEPGDWLLLGTDLVKDPQRLVSAYDDSQGITAQFNLNSLTVMNRELGADFEVDAYSHRAVWNAELSRVEMHVVAELEQFVNFKALECELLLAAGESLRTEISTKFAPDEIDRMLSTARFHPVRAWTDPAGDYRLNLARAI